MKQPRKEAEATALRYLERVQVVDQAGKYPGQLSGGQQQQKEFFWWYEHTGDLHPRCSRYEQTLRL